MGKKLKLICVLATLGALGVLASAGPAAAGESIPANNPFENGDPLNWNVPYVAWAGEEVRLVKCIDADISGDAEWAIVDWSGVDVQGNPARDPSFFDDVDRRTAPFAPTSNLFINGQPVDDQAGRTCWAIDIESNKPGMAVVKMAIDDASSEGGIDGSPVLKHQFLVIWMSMGAPVLEELSNASFPGLEFGDPLGDGNFNPGEFDGDPTNGNEFGHGGIRVTVDGSFPLGLNFADDLDGDADTNVVTLPDDWATLANRYAVSTAGRDPMTWDIHDDQGELEAHTTASFCNEGGSPIDAVDNCRWEFNAIGNLTGPFSRLVGGYYAVGPFDPVRPGTSLFPDGKLDAGDAPMPAARVDFSLTGGFGAFIGVRKQVVYSRDRTGNTLDNPATSPQREGAHNLYAPFYISLIPASSSLLATVPTSGTHGALANNFPGYQAPPLQNFFGVYDYWRLLNTHSRGGFNACKDVGGSGQVSGSGPIRRPTGIDAATVYTDEHGEAIIGFLPDVGVTLAPDAQGLCDLGEISDTPRQIATASISAEAQDPFQPVFDDVRSSNTLTKRLFSLAGKSLDCVPKTPIEAFCVETIRDIRGNPVEGAPVVFTREPNGIIVEASLKFGPFDTRGQNVLLPGSFGLFDAVIIETNALGQAGVVVKSTLPGLVDVDAENIATRNGALGVQRVRCLRFAGDGATLPIDAATCAGVSGTTAPGGTGGSGGTGGTGGNVTPVAVAGSGAAATVVSLAGNPVPAATKPTAKTPKAKAALKLASARFTMVKGKRYLVLRVNGGAPTAKVRITLVMRTGKVKAPVVRTLRTNKAVRLANLEISKHVQAVRVSILR